MRRWTRRCFAGVALLMIVAMWSVARGRTYVGSSTSVASLLEAVPSIAQYGVEACNLTIKHEREFSLVPAPSDTMRQKSGTLQLSQAGYDRILADFEWQPIDHSALPEELAAMISDGEPLLFSEALNKAFQQNPYYWHGFVVMPSSGEERALFVLIRDGDHPIR